MDEAELIVRCINKDKKAWDIFVERYAKLIYWAIKKRFSASSFSFNEYDAQNVFQEVFLTLLENDKLVQIKDTKLISGWLAMVASNKTIDFMREKISSNQYFAAGFVFADNECSQQLLSREITGIVKELIDGLRDKEKIIISLNLFDGKTHQEIADMLGVSINTVSTTIARVKEKLKKELEKKGIK
ncbi:MAG: sigma-70 family RNA polymerase sigma factor [Candidatus Omnitrophota bacterium]